MPGFARQAGARLFENRYSIGMWWWEVSEFPERFAGSFKYLDEIWVGSHHVADAIAGVSPIPVVKVTIPVSVPKIKKFARSALGLPESFVFLFVFDYLSIFERKNPLALVESFKKAFPPDSGASLVLKSINSTQHPEEHERLFRITKDHPDVHVIDRYVSVDEKNAMLAACDCYVSLHRSEGFGITLAEAMYLEKPVIATAYSGNLEFMTERNSYLVDYELKAIGEGSAPYPPTSEWADPDVEHATSLMRHVFEHQEEAHERGRRAAVEIRRDHSPETAGRMIVRRLKHIGARISSEANSTAVTERAAANHRPPDPQKDPLADLIVTTPVVPATQGLRGSVGSFVRRVMLRLIWPFAMQQRAINDQLLTRIKGVDTSLRDATQQLQQLQVQHAATAGEMKKLDYNLEALYPRVEAADRLLAESRAIPYVLGMPFEVFQESVVGRVHGYASQDRASSSEEVYDAFEDIFRDSEPYINDRQRRYLDLLKGREPVLNAGCGRGEFLDLLYEERIQYIGVDVDPDMIERCRAKGYEQVKVAHVNSYLKSCVDDSLGVIFSTRLIEHLPYKELLSFFALSLRKLKSDGLFIFETVNPHSIEAIKTFWVNPAHQHPVFPEVALALCKINGYESAYVFHPNGEGDVEVDRFREGEYALVATKAMQE